MTTCWTGFGAELEPKMYPKINWTKHNTKNLRKIKCAEMRVNDRVLSGVAVAAGANPVAEKQGRDDSSSI